MSDNPLMRPTYVGDYFTLSFSNWDDSEYKKYNGEVVKLLGFKPKIKTVFPHEVNRMTPQPGYYQVIGDPVVKHNVHGFFQVPIINLVPCNYRFTDSLPKNYNYIQETRKFTYLGPLPHIPYNIGDKVLVGAHYPFDDDFFSQIMDVQIRAVGIFFLMEYKEDVVAIQNDKIIDVLEHGEFSDIERFGMLQKTYEALNGKRISLQRHHDEENALDIEHETFIQKEIDNGF